MARASPAPPIIVRKDLCATLRATRCQSTNLPAELLISIEKAMRSSILRLTASRSGSLHQATLKGQQGCSGLGKEVGQRGPGSLGSVLHRDVARVGHHYEACSGYLPIEAPRVVDGLELVFLPPQEQRRQAHLFERLHQLLG